MTFRFEKSSLHTIGGEKGKKKTLKAILLRRYAGIFKKTLAAYETQIHVVFKLIQ